MFKKRIWFGIILSIILLAFSISGFTAYYKYTQESGTNFYVGTDDKADALEDTNELRQIIDDLGNLLGHSKRDDLYPKNGIYGGYLGRLNYGLDASRPAVPVVNDVYLATDTVKIYRCFVAANWVEVYPAAGVTTFLGLTDTPANYTDGSLKFVRVNEGETALEFAAEADPTVDTDAEIKAILVDEVTKTGDFTANRLPEINNSSGIIEQSDIEHKANGGYDFNANSVGFTTQTAVGDGNTTCDWRIGLKFRFVFGAQDETFTFTNPEFSCHLQAILIQDGTGNRTATWPAGIYWAGGTIPTLSTAGNARDTVNFFFDDYDDVYYGMSVDFAIP